MKRYMMVVSYDGSAYRGWQVQPNGATIQEKLESALKAISGETRKIHGSGRTDQGVHARKQVAHFDMESEIPFKGLKKGLNALLPADIRVMKLARARETFHARRSAAGKEYRYFIWNDDILPPFLRNYRLHVRNRLDVNAMREAARYLVGRHDFGAFTANPNREVESTVRELTLLKVAKRGPEVVIVARGSGFLYKMARSLAGFLVRVGEGDVPPSEAKAILASRKRTARVPTAPPQGLFLWNVTY